MRKNTAAVLAAITAFAVAAWAGMNYDTGNQMSVAGAISGGAAGQIPYQTAANATAFSAAGTSGNVLLSGGTGSPTWSNAPASTTNGMVFGVYISTTAAGAAGALVTAPCSNGSATAKAIGGGCVCTGGVALTSEVNRPDNSGAPAAGTTMPTGWACQAAGGTGGACVAFAVCANILH